MSPKICDIGCSSTLWRLVRSNWVPLPPIKLGLHSVLINRGRQMSRADTGDIFANDFSASVFVYGAFCLIYDI